MVLLELFDLLRLFYHGFGVGLLGFLEFFDLGLEALGLLLGLFFQEVELLLKSLLFFACLQERLFCCPQLLLGPIPLLCNRLLLLKL